MGLWRRATALLLAALLSGCAGLARPPEPGEPLVWSEHKAALEQLAQWSIEGKIGIRQDQHYNSASLSWQQQPGHYRIYLAGPLGQGAVDIDGNARQVVLNISGEGRFVADTPEQLLYQQLGWELPISSLSYWVRGLPAPGYARRMTLDPNNRLATLEQRGWSIRYKAYLPGAPTDLPRKLVLSRGTALKVTLVINRWRTDPAPL